MADPFQIDNTLGFLVGRASRLMAMTLNRKFQDSGYNLSVDHWIILSKLLREGGQKQQHLSSETGSDKTTITRMIDYMENRDWVYRQADQDDRRNKLIYLTNSGKVLQEELTLIAKTANESIEGHLNNEELETCKKVLKDLHAAFNKSHYI